jgi:WD40 repeat protein
MVCLCAFAQRVHYSCHFFALSPPAKSNSGGWSHFSVGITMSLTTTGTQQTQAIKPRRTFEGQSDWVKGVIHLPKGQWILTCSGSSLRVWNLQTAQQVGNDWRDGESFIDSIALSLDGKKVASGSSDGSVRLWEVDTGKVIAKWTGHTNEVKSLCWNRDRGRVVSGS